MKNQNNSKLTKLASEIDALHQLPEDKWPPMIWEGATPCFFNLEPPWQQTVLLVMRFIEREVGLHPSLWPLTAGKDNLLVVPHQSVIERDSDADDPTVSYVNRLTNEPYVIGFSGHTYDYHLHWQISEWWSQEHPETRGQPFPDGEFMDCERTCFLIIKNRDTLVEEQVGSPLVNAAIGSSWTVLLAEVIRREAEEEAS
jgi:hypothetical protein